MVASEAIKYGKKVLMIIDAYLETVKKEIQGYLEQSSLNAMTKYTASQP